MEHGSSFDTAYVNLDSKQLYRLPFRNITVDIKLIVTIWSIVYLVVPNLIHSDDANKSSCFFVSEFQAECSDTFSAHAQGFQIFFHFLDDISPFLELLIPLFWISSDICSRFQSLGGSLACVLCRLHGVDPTKSPLVRHLLIFWWHLGFQNSFILLLSLEGHS